jgi:hypothetical protein
MNNTLDNSMAWLITTTTGMTILSVIAGMLAIVFITLLAAFLKTLVKPNIEHTFYETILKKWFTGFFLRHKIVGAFIKMNNMGETIIDGITHLIGMFMVVAFLSSALTATLLYLLQNPFVYSPYLLFLMASNAMLAWSLGKNLLYFRKLVYRLK